MSLLFKERKQATNDNKQTPIERFLGWNTQLIRQFITTLGQIWQNPFSSLLTISVLGVSLTLPTTLHVLVSNGKTVNDSFTQAAEITLFLQPNLSIIAQQGLITQLTLSPKIETLQFISQTQALEEFKQYSGFGTAVDYLDHNPLPNVIIVTPEEEFRQTDKAKQLLTELEQAQEVDFGKLDVDWLSRLNAIIKLIEEAVWILGLVLILAVVLIIGNTIRLAIANRKEEIEVMKLVGATTGFIQRPFVMTGFWYGLFGGILAFLIVELMVWWLETSIQRLVNLYEGQFTLQGLSFEAMLVLILLAICLGVVGAYLSVWKYVDAIEPDTF